LLTSTFHWNWYFNLHQDRFSTNRPDVHDMQKPRTYAKGEITTSRNT